MGTRRTHAQALAFVVWIETMMFTATAITCQEASHNRSACLLLLPERSCQWNPLHPPSERCFVLPSMCSDRLSSTECVTDGRCKWKRTQRTCTSIPVVTAVSHADSASPSPSPSPAVAPVEESSNFQQNANLFVAITVCLVVVAWVLFCIISVDYGETETVAVHLKTSTTEGKA